MNRADSRFWPALPDDQTVVAEIGVEDGDTSILIARHLSRRGALALFDHDDKIKRVTKRLAAEGYHNVRGYGNTYKTFDSYNWSLMRLVKEHDRELFDYVYLDGMHSWHHDALAAYLCMRLLKVGGYLDIGDCDHTHLASPSNQHLSDAFTEAQIATKQVELVINLVIREDYRFEEVVPSKVFFKAQR